MKAELKSTNSPVSRIDSGRTHGWFARVYRGRWVGSRSFADRQYGGLIPARQAAEAWVARADALLPQLSPQPAKRGEATISEGRDAARAGLHYFQVYLPRRLNEGTWHEKRFYWTTLDERATARAQARDLTEAHTAGLREDERIEQGAWEVERQRVLAEVAALWPKVKAL